MTQKWVTAPPLFLPDSWGRTNLLLVCICSKLLSPAQLSCAGVRTRSARSLPLGRRKQVSRCTVRLHTETRGLGNLCRHLRGKQRNGGVFFFLLEWHAVQVNYLERYCSHQTPKIPITKLRLTFQRVISKNLDKIRQYDSNNRRKVSASQLSHTNCFHCQNQVF